MSQANAGRPAAGAAAPSTAADPTSNVKIRRDNLAFISSLTEYLIAGYQFLYVQTTEENRVEPMIRKVAAQAYPPKGADVVIWDVAAGFQGKNIRWPVIAIPGVAKGVKTSGVDFISPAKALDRVIDTEMFPSENTVFIFRDLDVFLREPSVSRRIRSLAEGNMLNSQTMSRPVIIVTPKFDIPDRLQSCITAIEFEMPTEDDFNNVMDTVQEGIESADGRRYVLNPQLREQIAINCLGLTATEAENAISRSLIRNTDWTTDMLTTLKDEKAQIIRKSSNEVLTFIHQDKLPKVGSLGGFDAYESWLGLRSTVYTRKAQDAGLDLPRGVVLLGVPGTGKSKMAEVTGAVLNQPVIRLNYSAIFSKHIGESEQRQRDVTKQLEAIGPAVVFIDEADKALGNAHNSRGDSGVTSRVFGELLNWLSRKTCPAFVVMTLNRTDNLPPELLRAGRFDALFYTDAPTAKARRQIFEIHFRQRKMDPAVLGFSETDWAKIVERTKGYVGAEIEQIVRDASYVSWADRETPYPTFDELLKTISALTPLSQRDAASFEEVRKFCQDMAQPVTTDLEAIAAPAVAKAGRQTRRLDMGSSG